MTRFHAFFATTAGSLVLFSFSPGCGPSRTGVRIGDETLKQFEAGQTTEQWLVAILGPPTSFSVVEGVEDTRVFRYRLSESKSGFMTLFTGGGEESVTVVYFIITRGIVTRFWADREIERDLLGQANPAAQGEKASAR